MSLNNSQMLPARVRNMRQMNDVLNAEDIILAEIERIIDEMYQRASLLHEELINEEWLENKLSEPEPVLMLPDMLRSCLRRLFWM